MPEPTQEQLQRARDLCALLADGRPRFPDREVALALAAEAAPLREEIERLTKENKGFHEIVADLNLQFLPLEQRADAAEAKVLSLEAEIERLKAGYARGWNDRDEQARENETPEMRAMLKRHRERWWIATHAERLADMAEYADAKVAQKATYAHQGVAETLRAAVAALAAASRAREEQGALRAALEAVQYSGWDYSEQNGCAVGVCPTCSRHLHASDCGLAAALAPPAAESQEKPLTCRQLVPSQYGYFGKCGFSPESHECGNPLPCPTHSPQENQQQLTGKGAK